MGTLREVVFDCSEPARLARFWADLLDGFEVRPYDDAAIASLSARGLTPETDTHVMVDGPDLKLCFQKTDTPSVHKNKLHLDIVVADRADVVMRLRDLGATIVLELDDSTWMRDPEDNDFCITDRW